MHTGLFDPGRALDHIKLAREATAIVVAPATADFLARAATGQANDLLTACLLAADVSRAARARDERSHVGASADAASNVEHLRELGYAVLDPDDGMLAAGEGSGPGRMPEPETIFAHVGRLLEREHARSPESACSSPPARRAKRSIRCASSPTTAAARWASRSRPRRGVAARRSISSPGR